MAAAPTFIQWLHAQALNDSGKKMPYSAIYKIGPELEKMIGTGPLDMLNVVDDLRDKYTDPEELTRYIEALSVAEATYRVDLLCYDGRADVAVIEEDKDDIVICGFRGTDGIGCLEVAVEDSGRCPAHGGAATDANVRQSLMLVAYARMLEGGGNAVDALLNVLEHSRSDMARVQAAKELLDRIGLGVDQQVTIKHETTDEEVDRMSALRERLDAARDRLQLTSIPVRVTEEDDGAHREAS